MGLNQFMDGSQNWLVNFQSQKWHGQEHFFNYRRHQKSKKGISTSTKRTTQKNEVEKRTSFN